MSATWMQGDVFEQLAKLPDASVDLIVTSPPFLALRSYLPADHPDKHREIGSEATPADFLDTLLELTAEWGRVLAPHGSICVELGDTYSGSTADGGDNRGSSRYPAGRSFVKGQRDTSSGWPLAKSMTLIPTLYPACIAYGRNLLTGAPSPAGQWRIRNVIVWARPNPPVGALGDKFRPATSYITVACKSAKRYFDLDAVRVPGPAGAPPLDWHTDNHPEDGDWLWKLATAPYKGAHYATYPLALPTRLIEAMCPQRVCRVCGKPSERITAVEYEPHGERREEAKAVRGMGVQNGEHAQAFEHGRATKNVSTLGWSDCGCPDIEVRATDPGFGTTYRSKWRRGIVLDPFAGSGTTGAAAVGVGRDATLIDIDARNLELARERIGMFLEEATA